MKAVGDCWVIWMSFQSLPRVGKGWFLRVGLFSFGLVYKDLLAHRFLFGSFMGLHPCTCPSELCFNAF